MQYAWKRWLDKLGIVNRSVWTAVRTWPMARTYFLALLAAPLFGGCTGSVEVPSGPSGNIHGNGGSGIGKNEHQVAFVCAKGADMPGTPLTRLSRLQYENTLHDLLRAELPAEAESIWQEVALVLAPLPPDSISKGTPFATMANDGACGPIDPAIRASSAKGTKAARPAQKRGPSSHQARAAQR